MPAAARSDDQHELSRRIAALAPWFHNIDLNGTPTAPDHFLGNYPADKFARFATIFPEDLTGKTVLDIGCNAGFYSVEALRRGASRVVGIDSDDRYLEQGRLATQALGFTGVEFRNLSVYDVAQLGERFDLVIFMGVLYHLRHPFHDLERIARASDLLWLETTLHDGEGSFIHFKPPAEGVHHIRKWFPTRACVRDMLDECKFTTIEDIPDPTPGRGSFLARR